MKRIIFHLFLIALLAGCSPSTKYPVQELKPELMLSASAQSCEPGETVTVTLTVSQQGTDGTFSLSAFVRQGEATITLDGAPMSTSGAWVPMAAKQVSLAITPSEVGDVVVSLQAQAPTGEISDPRQLKISVREPARITAQARYQARIVNPAPGARFPIRIEISGQVGKFSITPSVTTGQGRIFLDDTAANDTQCSVGPSVTFMYAPEVIGEHILEFPIRAGQAKTSVRVYIDLVKKISVAGVLEDCFSITGVGEYDSEGEEVVLALKNKDKYNFEVAAWCDATGNILSSEPSLPLRITRDCMTDLVVKLKRRTVTISRPGVYKKPYAYYVLEHGKPVQKTVYDYRLNFTSDYRLTETIVFSYEEYRYDTSTLPPLAAKAEASPRFSSGNTQSGFLWRIDNKFTIYLRKADNPGFTFNAAQRYIDSPTTRYLLPDDLTIQ